MPSNSSVILFCIYLLYVCVLTLSPFQFTWASERNAFLVHLSQDIDAVDSVLNTVGFLPFGFLLYWFSPGKDWGHVKFCVTACCAGLLSAAIELLQLYLPTRDPSLIDVITNTVGAALGFVLAFYVRQRSWYSWIAPLKNIIAAFGFTVYAAGVLIVFILTAIPQRLDGWDRGFPLLIGNEATLDRPWQGSIFSLLMFDRVLAQDEINAIHAIGPSPKLNTVQAHHPLLAYQFDEGRGAIAHDRSQLGEQIDLQVSHSGQPVWIPTGGLQLQEQTVIRSVSASEKIYRAITATDRFTIATWFQPTTLDQHGPARIVSLSESPRARNFTIAQEGAALHFRVRDLLSGRNGTRWVLEARVLDSTTDPTYAVFMYDKGIKSLYVNGRKVGEVYPPDGLTLIARSLHFDSDSHCQMFIVGCLLVGGAGMLLWPLAIKPGMSKAVFG